MNEILKDQSLFIFKSLVNGELETFDSIFTFISHISKTIRLFEKSQRPYNYSIVQSEREDWSKEEVSQKHKIYDTEIIKKEFLLEFSCYWTD